MQTIKNFFLNVFYTIFQGRPYRPSQYKHPGNAETGKNQQYRKKLLVKLFIIIGVPLIALMAILFLVRIYHVEGASMDPKFSDGQRILVQKWDKTWHTISGKTYVPDRFEVVVLEPPDGGSQVIKRVVGLPGERVIISGGKVLIINQDNPKGYDADQNAPPGVISAQEISEGDVDINLAEDEIFVLGDNRGSSDDSRLFGPVKINQIIGQHWDF